MVDGAIGVEMDGEEDAKDGEERRENGRQKGEVIRTNVALPGVWGKAQPSLGNGPCIHLPN